MLYIKIFKLSVILFAATFTISCKSEQQKLKDQYIKDSAEYIGIITKWFKAQEPYIQIDRIKIDTIVHPTQHQDSLMKFAELSSAINKIKTILESKQQQLSIETNKAKIFSDLGSKTLYEKSMNDVKSLQREYKTYLDAWDIMKQRQDNILSLCGNNLLDTIKKHGNMIQYSVIGSDSKNQEVKIDTAFIYITEDKHIRPLNIFKEYGLES